MLERFGLADAAEGVRRRFLDQAEDSDRAFAILLNPPGEVFERRRVKFQASVGLRQARRLRFDSWPREGACAWHRFSAGRPFLVRIRSRARRRWERSRRWGRRPHRRGIGKVNRRSLLSSRVDEITAAGARPQLTILPPLNESCYQGRSLPERKDQDTK